MEKSIESMDELQGALIDDENFLKEMVRIVCQRMMEQEITEFLGAQRHERTDERRGYRNGYQPRTLRARVGELNLMVPKDREGQFSTSLFTRYQRNEKALACSSRDVSARRINQEGEGNNRGSLWCRVLKKSGFRACQGT